MTPSPPRFDVPWWARAALAGAAAFPLGQAAVYSPVRLQWTTALDGASVFGFAALFAALNVVAADTGRRRRPAEVAALALIFGAIVAAVWSGRTPLSVPTEKFDLTFAYSAAFGAILGFRLARPGARPRLRRALTTIAGALCGALSWWFAIIGGQYVREVPGAALLKDGGPFAAACELVAWLPLAAAEALLARTLGRGPPVGAAGGRP